MRVMIIIKANQDSEQGKLLSERLFSEMLKFNEELVKAGILLAGEGLTPSSNGKRVRFVAGERPTLLDGPFAETKELIAGFWLWQVKSIDEAIEWVKRIPAPSAEDLALCPSSATSEIEIRPVFEGGGCGQKLDPDLAAREVTLRAKHLTS